MKTSLPLPCTLALSLSLGALLAGSAGAQIGPGVALSLDGVDDYVDVSDGVWFSGDFPAEGFTVEGWVYVRSYNHWSRLLDFGNVDPDTGEGTDNVVVALTEGTTGKPHFHVLSGADIGPGITAPDALPLNQWTHLACVLNNTTGTIYINGSAVASGLLQRPRAVWRNGCYLGRSNWARDSYANAIFDEVRIWNVVRSQSSIQANMHRSLPYGPEPNLSLAAYWRFAGGDTADTSGNRIHATLVNDPGRVPSGVPFAPDVVTWPATMITSTSAMLRGWFDPGNLDTTPFFLWGNTTDSEGGAITGVPSVGNGLIYWSYNLTGLTPNVDYYFRLGARNSVGASFGDEYRFMKLTCSAISAPSVTTLTASSVTPTTVTLNGSANPNNAAATGYFQWGITTNYGKTTAAQSLGSGFSPVNWSRPLTGLTLGTTYHFRAVATNTHGLSLGPDQIFTPSADEPSERAPYPNAVRADGPIAYYRFSDGVTAPGMPGPPKANNSGTLEAAANGTYFGGAIDGAEAPRPPAFIGFEANNTALQLNGVDSFVGTIAGLLNSKPRFTITGWIRSAAHQANRTGLFGQNDLVEFGYINNSTLECWTDNGLDIPNAFPNGEWNYVAIVSVGSPGTLWVYTNAVLAGARNSTIPADNSFRFNIGGGGVFDGSGNYFNGQIDEVAVFDKALSREQIANHYYSAVPQQPILSGEPRILGCECGTLVLSIGAVGTPPLRYQWLYSGRRLDDQNGATLVITNVGLVDNGNYSVMVENDWGSVESGHALVDETVVPLHPHITQALQSATRAVGGYVTFTAASVGCHPPTYQWQHNGANVAGASSPTLMLTNLQAADAGDYRLIVANGFGSATSTVAILTLVSPPVVTNLNDSGGGSLRDAISIANSCDCIERILFAAAVRGKIRLTSGELFINKRLIMEGPGAAQLAVSGNANSRVFHIGPQGRVDISGLNITEGSASGGGGGIAMDGGTLTVSNCVITGCYAQGVDIVSQGGGAIAVVGTANLTIIGSTLSSNTTRYVGGGLYLFNAPTVSLVNSTVSGNRTLDGINDEAWGGGIFVGNGSTLNVTNSTIANNSSVNQGGGVYKGFSGTVTLRNSLVAGNSAGGLGADCKGTFVSAGYNLIGNTSGSTGFGATGDQLNVNPLIGPLQDNGGPAFTHALLAGSPAIDKGLSLSFVTDQRGGPRIVNFPDIPNAPGGNGSDIGALEAGGYLRITDFRTNGPQMNVSFTTDPGLPYYLDSKDALLPGQWTFVPGSARTGDGTVLTVRDTRPRVPNRFYRAVMPWADPPTPSVYTNNFQDAVGPEWSVPQAVSITPVGGRKFLGEFASTVVSLQLANLPAHTHLSVSFDLFILKSWDGNRTDFGPDTFQLSVRGGPTLIRSTFSTYLTQSYPGALTDSLPANTGAVEINTLGYTHPNLGPADAVYRLTATFNHTAPSVMLDFSGLNLQDTADESWGLDNVRVEAISIP